jgi:CBS domain-containing protein
MVNKSIHTIPVLEGGKLVGIIGKEDILRTLVSSPKQVQVQ